MLDAVERRNLSDQITAKIRKFIIDEGLRSGDRLPTEQELADRFGVSRLSVREATRALAFLGILESAPRRGLTVGRVNMARVTEYLGFHLALSDYSKEHLLETRIIIETGVLPYVMREMEKDSTIYETLTELNDQLRQAHSLDRRIQADIAFHHALMESSGLELLVAFSDLLQVFFDRFRRSVASGDWKKGIEGHQRLIEALRRGQVEAAVQELRDHLDYHRHRE